MKACNVALLMKILSPKICLNAQNLGTVYLGVDPHALLEDWHLGCASVKHAQAVGYFRGRASLVPAIDSL